jgi:hypothetical protein
MVMKAQHFECVSGNDHNIVYDITDSAGAAQNVTGWTFNWELAMQQGSASVLTKSTTVGNAEIEITDAAAGEVTVKLLDTDTAALANDYYAELRSTDGSGTKTTEAWGIGSFPESQLTT